MYDLLIRINAIKKGHFILSSGLHSDTYIQCALIFVDVKNGEVVCGNLAKIVRKQFSNIDFIVAPAIGGIILGYEMARQLGVKAIFCERVDGKLFFRRGFSVPLGSNVLIVDDVLTSGKSIGEVEDCVNNANCNIVGACVLVDRCDKNPGFSFDIKSLLKINIKTYKDDKLPESLKQIPAIYCGSRPNVQKNNTWN